MPSYVVESCLPRSLGGERIARERRARSAAEELTREGTRVRFAGSIHVPEDEICFYTFDAPPSCDAAFVAAATQPLAVLEAVPSGEE